jgi:hypothetical protein
MPPMRGQCFGSSRASQTICSSATGEILPLPNVGTPRVRASRSFTNLMTEDVVHDFEAVKVEKRN